MWLIKDKNSYLACYDPYIFTSEKKEALLLDDNSLALEILSQIPFDGFYLTLTSQSELNFLENRAVVL